MEKHWSHLRRLPGFATLPTPITNAGERAGERFVEFFTAYKPSRAVERGGLDQLQRWSNERFRNGLREDGPTSRDGTIAKDDGFIAIAAAFGCRGIANRCRRANNQCIAG